MSDENTLKTTIIGIEGDATDYLRIMCNSSFVFSSAKSKFLP